MSLTVTRVRVKEKCGIAASTYDSTIDNLIAEVVPTLEYQIRSDHLADSGNGGLQATLSLGATEIVCAEFLDQLAREPGGSETVTVGELSFSPSDAPQRRLRESGWRRLRPYLKTDPSGRTAISAQVAGTKNEAIEQ